MLPWMSPFPFWKSSSSSVKLEVGLGMRDTKLSDFKVRTNFKVSCCDFRSPKSSPLYSPVSDSFALDG